MKLYSVFTSLYVYIFSGHDDDDDNSNCYYYHNNDDCKMKNYTMMIVR